MKSTAHPLMTNRAQFITHQMVRVLRLSLDRVAARRSGVLFEGASRVGKSRCTEFVAEQLKIQLTGVFTMLHVARHREPGRRQSVLKELCQSEQTKPDARGVDYLQHLLAYIEGRVTGQPAPQCVLVVDEIQHWRQNDFHVLADLYNYLQLQDINLTVIGFAQPEIYQQLSGLRAVQHLQIVARFFSEIIPFHGCQNVDELTAILQACDEGSEYLVGSGISYTAFFAPEAFAAGLRLAPLAGLLWKTFDESVAGKYVNNLPMQHVRESILDLLLLIAPHDSALFEADDKLVTEAACRGYFKSEEILACHQSDITVYVPKPMTSGAKADGRFSNADFIYDTETDEYKCPAGQRLIWRFTSVEKGLKLHRYWSSHCQNCALKAQCTPSTERRVRRWEHESVLANMQQRLDQTPEMMRIRKQTVEHPFGTLKAWMGATHFLTKTLPRVSTEMSLHVLAYNMKRVIKILGSAAVPGTAQVPVLQRDLVRRAENVHVEVVAVSRERSSHDRVVPLSPS